ncbi:unnamed protein product [Nippostrongylus brasiliensis]|uniref:DUF3553 domain-containing protein n=1 Tax=Nippostrongylus brasiliensis TaxID=27835 RepID=A0A0N4XK51_NIPBR|nr:unnamed protein product [Nippostrongylus brasiliensis]
MDFAVVFFPHSRSADVVPANSVQGQLNCGITTKVRWSGRLYTAKILFAGPKELCELKVLQVTGEGELADGPFEIAASGSTSAAATPVGPNSEERERMRRLISIEEHIESNTETVGRIHRTVTNIEPRVIRLEKTLKV